jgi:hypothetical protein
LVDIDKTTINQDVDYLFLLSIRQVARMLQHISSTIEHIYPDPKSSNRSHSVNSYTGGKYWFTNRHKITKKKNNYLSTKFVSVLDLALNNV